jgi:hypothetical protein
MATVAAAQGQAPRGEIFVSAGSSGFSRFDDQGFGRHADFGGGAAFRLSRRVALQADVHHVYGLDLADGECADGAPCSATSMTGSALFMMGTGRVQPYLQAGVVLLRSESATVQQPGTPAVRESDTGFGPLVGGGVKIMLTRTVYVQPAFWMGTTVLMSRSNLSTSRASVGVGYVW